MNLVMGKLVGAEESGEALSRLKSRVLATLRKEPLDFRRVADACGLLSESLNEREHLPIIMQLGLDEKRAALQLAEVKRMLSREYLLYKVKTELGEEFVRQFVPPYEKEEVREEIRPLGVLLHIAAGNAEGLPFFSVVEGLLAGNINILKLPGADDGVSTTLLLKLMEIDPALAEYIYVFDAPSDDFASMRAMAEAADGIAVWGSDQTVRAVRQLADENMKIIEWGHKASFAYITKGCFSDRAQLALLAHNICSTEQLLCSSCQGIFLDTGDMEDVYGFCETFINILQEVSGAYPQADDAGLRAGVTLKLRNLEMESALGTARVYKGNGCSLAALPGNGAEPSIAFRNCWVKRLPRELIPETLKPEKNHLQTMALLCTDGERDVLANLMFKTGFVRAANPENMSRLLAGAPHDGEYALRRYTKIVRVE